MFCIERKSIDELINSHNFSYETCKNMDNWDYLAEYRQLQKQLKEFFNSLTKKVVSTPDGIFEYTHIFEIYFTVNKMILQMKRLSAIINLKYDISFHIDKKSKNKNSYGTIKTYWYDDNLKYYRKFSFSVGQLKKEEIKEKENEILIMTRKRMYNEYQKIYK